MDGDSQSVQEEKEKKTEATSEDNIDPVMKQYMEMIQQQKDKEKEVGSIVNNCPSNIKTSKN